MTLRLGCIHNLRDVLSRAAHIILGKLEVGNLSTSSVSIDLNFKKNYAVEQLFGTIWKFLTCERPKDAVEENRISRLITSFRVKDEFLY